MMTVCQSPSAFTSASGAPGSVFTSLQAIADGREAAYEHHMDDLINRFARALGGLSHRRITRENRAQFLAFSTPKIALRGFQRDDIFAVVLPNCEFQNTLSEPGFWARVENPFELPLILTCSRTVFRAAAEKVGTRFALVLSPEDLTFILQAENGLEAFKRVLRDRFSISTLHPFDPHHPATDYAFLGRDPFLNLLRDNPMTNYAIVGPSKMGKTSLIKQYLRRSRGLTQRFYCDLYNVPADDLAVSRTIRMALDPGAHAYYDAPDKLHQFVCRVRAHLGAPIEIILDETDKHCRLSTPARLVHIAQERVCRVIFIGRWALMEATAHCGDEGLNRLEPLVLEPLELDEGLALVERPLNDLGFDTRTCQRALYSAVDRCGRVPGHLHEFGACLIEEIKSCKNSLEAEHVQRALGRVLSSSRLCALLDDLSGPPARASALAVALFGERGIQIDPLWLRKTMAGLGLELPVKQCMQICNELMIHHLLVYRGGGYSIGRWDFAAEGSRDRALYEAMLADYIKESAPSNKTTG